MGILKSLIGKKKSEETDGQEKYFKEDFPPVVKKPASKKPEAKPAEPKKAVKAEKSEPKKAAEKKEPAKKATPKKSESKRVVPQPVERIINPKGAAAKKIAMKDAEKVASKPQKKAAKPEKTVKAEKSAVKNPTAKAAVKAEPKKTVSKPAAKAEPKTASKVKELYDDSPEVKGAVAVSESNETANGKWDIRRAKDGRFFFSLYASNHTVIAYSQIYSSTSAVSTGINSVITNAPKAEIEDTTLKKTTIIPCPKWEIYYDKAGEYRFRLYAPNGLVVCHSSHGYSTKGGCKGGIESIKRFSAEAKVDKSYLK